MGVIYYRTVITHQTKNDRRLICNVKSFPAIYDTSHPSFNDRSERKRVWGLIAQNLQSSGDKCEERWNKLVEMYKTITVPNLHIDIYEMMDQLLNMQNGSADLTADDYEERIDLEVLLTSELIAEDQAPLLPDICSFTADSSEVPSEYSDSFYETENVEFYSY